MSASSTTSLSAAEAPRRLGVVPDRQPVVVEGASSAVLSDILRPDTGLAVWQRPVVAGLDAALYAILALPAFSTVAAGAPEEAAAGIMQALPAAAGPLAADLLHLARLFGRVTGQPAARLRLEHVTDDACRRHHVDAVGLRMLCTYAGPGTEWLDACGCTLRMRTFHVGLFKGAAYPDAAPRVLHRSPPVEHLTASRRSRVLLCIDQSEQFP